MRVESPEWLPATPGDVCILLEPGADDREADRRESLALQRTFGGRPEPDLHLTCQRFHPGTAGQISGVVARLGALLTTVEPPIIAASGLIRFDSGFWKSSLLRWTIPVDGSLRAFLDSLDKILVQAGLRPHYPPSHQRPVVPCTALYDLAVDASTFDARLEALRTGVPFPWRLFVPRAVTLTEIEGTNQFRVLARLAWKSRLGDRGRTDD